MITVDEADRLISENKLRFVAEEISIHRAFGRVLAEDLLADADIPPFNRVAMDGIAIRFEDFRRGVRTFISEGIQKAGEPRKKLISPNACFEVMTGAVLPSDTDTVIPYEQLEESQSHFLIGDVSVKKGQHIHSQGMDKKAGETIASRGTKMSAVEIGATASIGKEKIRVTSMPRITIITTGDELVELNEIPEAWQIRRSNVYMLKGLLHGIGLETRNLHLRDDEHEMTRIISTELLNNDVLLFSGAVSKGKFDHLPAVLSVLGVEKIFHRVAQKPGKPFWFGRKENCVVFAFPGNPVSCMLCAVRYFLPWYELSTMQIENYQQQNSTRIFAHLKTAVSKSESLTHFLLCKMELENSGKVFALPVFNNGSGDYSSLAQADGFLELPAGKSECNAGEVYPLHLFRTVL